MTATAVVISMVALVVSIWALWYSRQQAMSARQQAAAAEADTARETQRRHEERRPTFTADIEEKSSVHHLLRLQLISVIELTRVAVEITEGDGVQFTPDQAGIDPAQRPPRREAVWTSDGKEPAPLHQYERAMWRVELSGG